MTTRRRRFARLIHSRIEPRPETTETAGATVPLEDAGTEAADGHGATGDRVETAAGEDVLAVGIAEVFAAIREAVEASDDAATAHGDGAASLPADAAGANGSALPDEAPDVAIHRLLGELERLWQRAA
jgi:hypothetical protein